MHSANWYFITAKLTHRHSCTSVVLWFLSNGANSGKTHFLYCSETFVDDYLTLNKFMNMSTSLPYFWLGWGNGDVVWNWKLNWKIHWSWSDHVGVPNYFILLPMLLTLEIWILGLGKKCSFTTYVCFWIIGKNLMNLSDF